VTRRRACHRNVRHLTRAMQTLADHRRVSNVRGHYSQSDPVPISWVSNWVDLTIATSSSVRPRRRHRDPGARCRRRYRSGPVLPRSSRRSPPCRAARPRPTDGSGDRGCHGSHRLPRRSTGARSVAPLPTGGPLGTGAGARTPLRSSRPRVDRSHRDFLPRSPTAIITSPKSSPRHARRRLHPRQQPRPKRRHTSRSREGASWPDARAGLRSLSAS
jgi:hypothetical protein